MRSSELLDLAKKLQAQVLPSDKPMIRNIVGRAYYSCFHKVHDIAIDKYSWQEVSNIKGGMHEKLYSRLDNHHFQDIVSRKNLAQIKSDLIKLKKKRVNADYNLNIEMTKLDSDYCIRTAELVNNRLDSI